LVPFPQCGGIISSAVFNSIIRFNRSNPINSDTKISWIYGRNHFVTPNCHATNNNGF
jgi:hypothetical protein